jgi:hypothetical protein
MFFFVSDWFKNLIYLSRVILSSSMWLFIDIVASLTLLNVILNGLKQYIFNGCRTCDVWDGNAMSNLNSYVCLLLN